MDNYIANRIKDLNLIIRELLKLSSIMQLVEYLNNGSDQVKDLVDEEIKRRRVEYTNL